MARIRSALLPLLVLVAGGSIAGFLISTRPVAEQQEPDDPITLVKAEVAQPGPHRVMREPHLDAARAQLSSARSRIEKAKRDVGKTIIQAPFPSDQHRGDPGLDRHDVLALVGRSEAVIHVDT